MSVDGNARGRFLVHFYGDEYINFDETRLVWFLCEKVLGYIQLSYKFWK